MSVLYRNDFIKQLAKLPIKIENRFYERLAVFIVNKLHPLLNNHSVDKAFPGCRSINITGDYRAIFQEQDNVVIFVKIGTRSELYR